MSIELFNPFIKIIKLKYLNSNYRVAAWLINQVNNSLIRLSCRIYKYLLFFWDLYWANTLSFED